MSQIEKGFSAEQLDWTGQILGWRDLGATSLYLDQIVVVTFAGVASRRMHKWWFTTYLFTMASILQPVFKPIHILILDMTAG